MSDSYVLPPYKKSIQALFWVSLVRVIFKPPWLSGDFNPVFFENGDLVPQLTVAMEKSCYNIKNVLSVAKIQDS